MRGSYFQRQNFPLQRRAPRGYGIKTNSMGRERFCPYFRTRWRGANLWDANWRRGEGCVEFRRIFFCPFSPFSSPVPSVHPAGPGPGESTRRGFHQRAPVAQPHPPQDRGDGSPRDPALRDFQAAQGLPRLRFQNPLQVPRDGLHPTRGHRGQQAQGECNVGPRYGPDTRC